MRAYSLSQIYTSGGAIPAIEYPLAAPVFGTISPPRSQARLMGHTPFFFESWYNVERTVTLSVVGFAALFTIVAHFRQENSLQAERVRLRVRRCRRFRVRVDDHIKGRDADRRRRRAGDSDRDPDTARRARGQVSQGRADHQRRADASAIARKVHVRRAQERARDGGGGSGRH